MKQNKNKYYICTAKNEPLTGKFCMCWQRKIMQHKNGEVAQLVRARDS